MRGKKTFGFILMILGICCFIFGTIIASQVRQGETKIQNAQKGVNTVRNTSKINPYAHEIGKLATKPVQQKINEGKTKAGKFKVISFWFRIGGIALFIVGLILLVL